MQNSNPGNIQHPTSNAQRPKPAPMEAIGCSMLDVGCWMFSFGREVRSATKALRIPSWVCLLLLALGIGGSQPCALGASLLLTGATVHTVSGDTLAPGQVLI